MNTQQRVHDYDPDKNIKSKTSTQSSLSASSQRPLHIGATRFVRVVGIERWEEATLAEWPDNDSVCFGVTWVTRLLTNYWLMIQACFHHFSEPKSFEINLRINRVCTVFVSFGDPFECAKALREMNWKNIGIPPVELHKSKWENRIEAVAHKKMKKKIQTKAHLFGP